MKKVIIILAALLVACSGTPEPAPAPRFVSTPQDVYVIYEVTGFASSVSLTYENESGNTEQRTSARLPYRKTMYVEPGAFLYLSAQNNTGSGTLECKIIVNGQVVETATSSGEFAIATCSGSAE